MAPHRLRALDLADRARPPPPRSPARRPAVSGVSSGSASRRRARRRVSIAATSAPARRRRRAPPPPAPRLIASATAGSVSAASAASSAAQLLGVGGSGTPRPPPPAAAPGRDRVSVSVDERGADGAAQRVVDPDRLGRARRAPARAPRRSARRSPAAGEPRPVTRQDRAVVLARVQLALAERLEHRRRPRVAGGGDRRRPPRRARRSCPRAAAPSAPRASAPSAGSGASARPSQIRISGDRRAWASLGNGGARATVPARRGLRSVGGAAALAGRGVEVAAGHRRPPVGDQVGRLRAGSPTTRRRAPGPLVSQTTSNWPSSRISPISTGLVMWWFGPIELRPAGQVRHRDADHRCRSPRRGRWCPPPRPPSPTC